MERNLFVILLVSAIIGFAGSLFGTVFNLYLWDMEYSFFEITLLNAIPLAINLLFARFFGRLADLYGPKKFIASNLALVTLSYFSFALIIIRGAQSFEAFAILFGLNGLAGAIGGGAFAALATRVYKKGTGQSTGLYMSSSALGWTLGSFLSGIIADTWGMGILSFLAGSLDALALILFVSLFRGVKATNDKRLSIIEVLRLSWRLSIGGDRSLSLLYLVMGIYTFGGAVYNIAFTIKVYVMFGSKTNFGFLMGLAGLTNMITPYFVGRIGDAKGKEPLLVGGLVVRDIYMFYLALTWDRIATAIFMIAPMWVFIHIPLVSLTTDYGGVGHESEAQSMKNIVMNISNFLGLITSGFISRGLSLHENIRAIDTILVIGALIYVISVIPAILLWITKRPSKR